MFYSGLRVQRSALNGVAFLSTFKNKLLAKKSKMISRTVSGIYSRDISFSQNKL